YCLGIYQFSTAGIHEKTPSALPRDYTLELYPNPFNQNLNVRIALPVKGDVQLSLHNLLGQEVARIFSGALMPGIHRFSWNAQDDASGRYFLRLYWDGGREVKPVVLVK
ncbi:MAG: T9SS type A sorting domain-containing protein, partial [bacterium]